MLRTQSLIALGLCLAIQFAPTTLLAEEPRQRYREDTLEQQRAVARDARDYARQLNRQVESQLDATTRLDEEGGEGAAGVLEAGGQVYELNKLFPGATKSEVDRLKTLHGASVEEIEDAGRERHRSLREDHSDAAEAVRMVAEKPPTEWESWVDDPDVATAQANGRALEQSFADCRTTRTVRPGRPEDAFTRSEATCEVLNVRPNASRSRELDVRTVETDETHYLLLSGTTKVQFGGIVPRPDGGGVIDAGIGNIDVIGRVGSIVALQEPSPFNDWSYELEATPASPPPPPVCRLRNGASCAEGDPDCTCTQSQVGVQVTVSLYARSITESISSSPEEPLMDTDGWCKAKWTCKDNAARTIAGVAIDQSFSPYLTELYPAAAHNSPTSSESPICYHAEAVYDCPYNLGQLCWTRADGSSSCTTNTSANTSRNTCAELTLQEGCAYRSARCNQDADSPFDEFCYVQTAVYECLTESDAPTAVVEETNSCAGIARCAGDNCVDLTEPKNVAPAKVMTDLALMQTMLSDYEMDPDATLMASQKAAGLGLGESGRIMFPGQPYECSKALGGSMDCCKETDAGGKEVFWNLYAEHMRKGNAKIQLAELEAKGAPEVGIYEKLSGPGGVRFEDMHGLLVSDIEALLGNRAGNQRKLGANQAKEYSESQGGIVGEGNRMSQVMSIYRAEMMEQQRNGWYCSAEELDLSIQRDAEACSYVGSYCKSSVLGACIEKRDTYMCFNSPFSRAIQEHLHREIDQPFGTAKNPQSPKVTLDDLSRMDLNELPKDELKGFLSGANAVPSASSLETMSSLSRLTGASSRLGPEDRFDLAEQSVGALSAFDHKQAFAGAKSDLERRVVAEDKAPIAGDIALGPAVVFVQAGKVARMQVNRRGSQGRVSVNWTTEDNSARAGADYHEASGTLTWESGDERPQYVEVRTLPREYEGESAPPEKELRIRLSNPTGGARIHPVAAGDIVLNPKQVVRKPENGRPVGGFSATKRFLMRQDYPVGNHEKLITYVFDITLKNDTGQDIVSLTIDDTPERIEGAQPPYEAYPITNLVRSFDPLGQGDNFVWDACWPPNGTIREYMQGDGMPAANCEANYRLAAGASVRFASIMYFRGRAEPARVTNRCRVRARLEDGTVIDIGDGSCQATYQSPAADGANLGNCQGVTEESNVFINQHALAGYDATFGGQFGERAGSVEVQLERPLSIALRSAALNRSSGTLSSSPGSASPSAPYALMKLSSCPSDYAMPEAGASEAALSCTNVEVDAQGNARVGDGAIRWQVGGPRTPGVCLLEPGVQYFWTILTDDPADGIHFVTYNQLCESQAQSWRGCRVRLNSTIDGVQVPTASKRAAPVATGSPPPPAFIPTSNTQPDRPRNVLTPINRPPPRSASEAADIPATPSTRPAGTAAREIYADRFARAPLTVGLPATWRRAGPESVADASNSRARIPRLNGKLDVTLGRGEYASIEVPAEALKDSGGQIIWGDTGKRRAVRPFGVYMTLTREPADFRILPAEAACRMPSDGSRRSTGEMVYSVGPGRGCMLQRGASYFLNILFDAPADGLDSMHHACQEDRSGRCTIQLRFE